ncbi:tetratricopeptide repeat protein [Myxococcota bacterium]|nr:tetratricopeptide repeat protein [Myxococcota bacterium]MBU1382165.1 tetratricopeptide repeat protein [Myxococcota bacterium]MBU1498745.1 tetratricopeptide repeat protein [Myxococcota bacterium]
MVSAKNSDTVLELLNLCEIMYMDWENLNLQEKTILAFLFWHITGDLSLLVRISGETDSREFQVLSLVRNDEIEKLKTLYNELSFRFDKLTLHETRLWSEIWLYIMNQPEKAETLIDATSFVSDLNRELCLSKFLSGKHAEALPLFESGGLPESRFYSALIHGDIHEDWLEARKQLSKTDALETLMKSEYSARANQHIELFYAAEMTVFGNIGEADFKDAVLFQYASTGVDDLSIEQLVSLTERTGWAMPLALLTAINVAANKNEDVVLVRLYHRVFQAAQTTELRGAAALRAALISEFRLKRYREAEEFYRLAIDNNSRPSISRHGLMRMLLHRKAYSELVDLAFSCDDEMIRNAGMLSAELRLHDFDKAWQLLQVQDIFSRIRLSVYLKKWDELHTIYKTTNPYIPQSVTKLIIALYHAHKENWREAEGSLFPLESVSELVTNLVMMYWNRSRDLIEKAINCGENACAKLQSQVAKRAVYLIMAKWTETSLPSISSQLMGKYLENGGVISAKTDRELLDLLLNHPDPDPAWFADIEHSIDDFILEFDAAKEWDKLASLIELKVRMVTSPQKKVELYLRLAHLFEEAIENIDKASKYYTEVLNLSSNNKVALEALSRINETNESWDEYLQVLRLSMEANDDPLIKAGLYFKYGSVLETQFGKDEEALRYYKLAIDSCPTSLPALHGMRDIYVQRENWKGVLNTLKMEASIWDDPKEKAGIYTQMGEILHEKLDRRDQAERYFEAALALRPDSPGALRALFSIYFKDENWEKAGEIAAGLGPKALTEGTSEERAVLNFQRGLAFLKVGEQHEAANSFIMAIQLDKSNLAPLHAILGLTTDYGNEVEISVFLDEMEAVYKDSDNPIAISMISVAKAKFARQEGNNLDALEFFRTATSKSPDMIEAVEGETELLLYMGEEDKAFERWKSFSDSFMSKTKPSDMLRMVDFYSENLDRGRDAMAALRKLLQSHPNDSECLYELASELYASGQLKEALVTMDRLLTLSQREKTSIRMKYTSMAILLKHSAGETKKVDELLSQINFDELKPEDCFNILYVYAMRGEIARAVTIVKKVKTSSEKESILMNLHMAILAILAGNTNGAIEELEGIVNKSTTSRMILADLGMLANDRNLVMKYLELLVDDCWDNPQYLENLAQMIPGRSNRGRRLAQVRSIFDPGSVSDVTSIPWLKAGLMSSDEFKRKIGIKDPTGHETQMWFAIRTGIETVFRPVDPALTEARPAKGVELHGWEEVEATLGTKGKLWVADLTTRSCLILNDNQEISIVVKPEIFNFPLSTIRYIFARALEAARSGFSMFFQTTAAQRTDIRILMYGLGLPPEERDETVKRFLETLPRQEQRAVERVSSSSVDIFQTLDLEKWMNHVETALDRTGLLVCGDITAAFQGNAWLASRHSVVSDNNLANFAVAPRAGSLVKEFISPKWDTYLELEPSSN